MDIKGTSHARVATAKQNQGRASPSKDSAPRKPAQSSKARQGGPKGPKSSSEAKKAHAFTVLSGASAALGASQLAGLGSATSSLLNGASEAMSNGLRVLSASGSTPTSGDKPTSSKPGPNQTNSKSHGKNGKKARFKAGGRYVPPQASHSQTNASEQKSRFLERLTAQVSTNPKRPDTDDSKINLFLSLLRAHDPVDYDEEEIKALLAYSPKVHDEFMNFYNANIANNLTAFMFWHLGKQRADAKWRGDIVEQGYKILRRGLGKSEENIF